MDTWLGTLGNHIPGSRGWAHRFWLLSVLSTKRWTPNLKAETSFQKQLNYLVHSRWHRTLETTWFLGNHVCTLIMGLLKERFQKYSFEFWFASFPNMDRNAWHPLTLELRAWEWGEKVTKLWRVHCFPSLRSVSSIGASTPIAPFYVLGVCQILSLIKSFIGSIL